MELDKQLQQLEEFVIDNSQLDKLETLISEFNIFEAIGAVKQELRHSDYLAFLLNPLEKHGLDDRLLKRFLVSALLIANEPPLSPIQANLTDFSDAVVEREIENIDILIHDQMSGIVCLIENKIMSSEHTNQLQRYYNIVKQRYVNATAIIPIFLTPDGIMPEDEDSPYIPFSYGEIAKIIEETRQRQESMIGVDVNTLMRHYVNMLRRHIVSDSDIAELCQQIYRTHKSAIDLIIEHIPDMRQDISDSLANVVQQNHDLVLLSHQKSYIRFRPRVWEDVKEFNLGIGWANTTALIAFEIYVRPEQLTLYLELGPVKDEHEHIRKAIFNYAADHRKVFKHCRPKLTSKWTLLYKLPLLTSKHYEDASLDDLMEIVEPKWDGFLEDLPELEQHLSQIKFE